MSIHATEQREQIEVSYQRRSTLELHLRSAMPATCVNRDSKPTYVLNVNTQLDKA